MIGVHQTQVSNYENEKNAVPEERVESIAHALGATVPHVRQRLGLWVPDPKAQTATSSIRDDARRVALDLAAGRTVDVPISLVTDNDAAEVFSRELASAVADRTSPWIADSDLPAGKRSNPDGVYPAPATIQARVNFPGVHAHDSAAVTDSAGATVTAATRPDPSTPSGPRVTAVYHPLPPAGEVLPGTRLVMALVNAAGKVGADLVALLDSMTIQNRLVELDPNAPAVELNNQVRGIVEETVKDLPYLLKRTET